MSCWLKNENEAHKRQYTSQGFPEKQNQKDRNIDTDIDIDILKEIYCEGLAHVNMEAEKLCDLLFVSGGPGKPVV